VCLYVCTMLVLHTHTHARARASIILKFLSCCCYSIIIDRRVSRGMRLLFCSYFLTSRLSLCTEVIWIKYMTL
jgi:hypothetical protein